MTTLNSLVALYKVCLKERDWLPSAVQQALDVVVNDEAAERAGNAHWMDMYGLDAPTTP